MRKWSAFRLTLWLTPLNAVLFSNSTCVQFHNEQCQQWLILMQHPQNSCSRISQVNTSTAFSANPCSIIKNSNFVNFYTTSDSKWNHIKHFSFQDITCHFAVLQENKENRIALNSSSNMILNCTTLSPLNEDNKKFYFWRKLKPNLTLKFTQTTLVSSTQFMFKVQ